MNTVSFKINDNLLKTAMQIYNISEESTIIELALQELIKAHKRHLLAAMFGKEKTIKNYRRRRSE